MQSNNFTALEALRVLVAFRSRFVLTSALKVCGMALTNARQTEDFERP